MGLQVMLLSDTMQTDPRATTCPSDMMQRGVRSRNLASRPVQSSHSDVAQERGNKLLKTYQQSHAVTKCHNTLWRKE